jgi:carboxyl-terminal processing protease
LFLAEGTILHVQSTVRSHSRTHRVTEPGMAAHLRLVVLVDGETASAAEILAGALKELRSDRTAWFLGQTTFGKGTIQFFVQTERTALEKIPGGIRITAGRFFSPSHQPISGLGIVPHELMPTDADFALLERAKQKVKEMLHGTLVPRAPVMMTSASTM